MIGSFALLLACQLLGELLHRAGLPLPGAVTGMLLLLGWLALRRREQPELNRVAAVLTANLSILFVPSAVGLVEEGDMLARYGVGIVVATTLSTLLTLAVAAAVFHAVARRAERRG